MPIPGYVNEDENLMVLCGALMALTMVVTAVFPEAVARWTTPASEWDTYRDDMLESNKRFRARKRRLRELREAREGEDDHPYDPLEVEMKADIAEDGKRPALKKRIGHSASGDKKER